jgi:hypothetical protein
MTRRAFLVGVVLVAQARDPKPRKPPKPLKVSPVLASSSVPASASQLVSA